MPRKIKKDFSHYLDSKINPEHQLKSCKTCMSLKSRKPKKRIHEHKFIAKIVIAMCRCSEKRAYNAEKRLQKVIQLVEKSA